MAEMIYQIIELVFGGGLATEVSKWMDSVWGALNTLLVQNGLVSTAYGAFSAVGAGLLILYFYMELASKASMDLLTLEKLVVMFIKFLIAFIILINIQDILNGLLSFGNGIYDIAVKSTTDNPTTGSFQWYLDNHPGDPKGDIDPDTGNCKALIDLLDDTYGGITKFFKAIGVLIPGLIAYIIMLACKFVCYFVTTKNALDICIRAWMAPIAVPQLFEDGQRSAGVRYIKGFVAATLEMAVIIIILRVASDFSLAIQDSLNALNGGKVIFSEDYPQYINLGALEKALKPSGMLSTLLVNIVATGMIAGAGRITHDVIGG